MKSLLIVGAGGHGQVVKETVDALGKFERIEFLDDVNPMAIGKLEEMEKFREHFDCIFPAVGNNELRRKIMENAKKLNYEVPVLILLRKTSLDELPQIFNIIRGDRGIIGTTKKTLNFTRFLVA